MPRIILILSLSALLSACATSNNYNLAVNSWVGTNVNQLVSVWGYPNRSMRAPDGNRLYVYHNEYHGRTPTYTTPGGTTVVTTRSGKTLVRTTPSYTTGGESYDLQCTTWFEVNKRNVIVKTRWRGNNCVADKTSVRQWSNPRKMPVIQ